MAERAIVCNDPTGTHAYSLSYRAERDKNKEFVTKMQDMHRQAPPPPFPRGWY